MQLRAFVFLDNLCIVSLWPNVAERRVYRTLAGNLPETLSSESQGFSLSSNAEFIRQQRRRRQWEQQVCTVCSNLDQQNGVGAKSSKTIMPTISAKQIKWLADTSFVVGDKTIRWPIERGRVNRNGLGGNIGLGVIRETRVDRAIIENCNLNAQNIKKITDMY